MATKLFLRNTTANGITDTGDGVVYDMVTVAGAAADTDVVNTVASGTNIQWTQAGGGSTIAFISGRVPAGGFTLTTTDISIWAQENNMSANAGGRYRVYRYQPGAPPTITELGGGPFDDGVEFGTAATEMLWVGNVTDQAFSEDDRLLLRLFITNAPALTMGGGFTCTLTFNAADAATGDSFFNIAETVTFKPETIAVNVSDTTAVAHTEAATLLVGVTLAEAVAAVLVDAVSSLPVLLLSETLPVQLAEALTSLGLIALGDVVAANLDESPNIFVPLSTLVDSFGVTLADVVQAVINTLNPSDSIRSALTETAQLLVTETVLDSAAVTASEALSILTSLFPADTLPVTLNEITDLVVMVQVGDQTAVGLADQASLLAMLTTLAETLAVRLVEGTPSIAATGMFPVSASDALAVALVESTPTVIIVLSAADTVRTALGEAPTILTMVATADATPVLMQEAATLVGYLQTADAAALALLESDPTIFSTLGIADPVQVILDDTAGVLAIVLSQDSLNAALAEIASILGLDVNRLGPAYLATLRALVPARTLTTVGATRTLTALGATRTLGTA